MLVTHSLGFLSEVDHVVVLEGGAVAAQGAHEEVLSSPPLQRLLGALNDHRAAQQGDDEGVEEEEEEEDWEEELAGMPAGALTLKRIRTISEMSKKSRISEKGSKNGSLVKLDSNKNEEKSGEKLIEAERSETGTVGWSVYLYYFGAVGWVWTLLAVVGFH